MSLISTPYPLRRFSRAYKISNIEDQRASLDVLPCLKILGLLLRDVLSNGRGCSTRTTVQGVRALVRFPHRRRRLRLRRDESSQSYPQEDLSGHKSHLLS